MDVKVYKTDANGLNPVFLLEYTDDHFRNGSEMNGPDAFGAENTLHLAVPAGQDPRHYEPVLVDGVWELQVDATAQAAADAVDLVAAKTALAATYVKEVYDELEVRFGTRRDDTMNADLKTWEMMSADPAAFSAGGYLAVRATTTYAVGDALDTDMKVQGYANECLADVKSYANWRLARQKTYLADLAAL